MANISKEDLAALAQVNASTPRFVEYLKRERATSLKYMTEARDPIVINRAQGAYKKLDQLINDLESAKDHLHANKA